MRPEKESIINEYSLRMKEAQYLFLADFNGLTVEQFQELRKQLRDNNTKISVVKNGLLQLALKNMGWDELLSCLEGPVAMVYGDGDVTNAAKKIRDFSKNNKSPVLKGGETDGSFLTAQDIDEMADMPPREVLLGKLVGTIAAPMNQLVGVMNQKVASLVYVLKAVEEKKNN